MIKIRELSNNKIIPLWILRILLISKRVLSCYLMLQVLNLTPKLLGLLKRKHNKKTKNDTCRCSSKITDWSICLCPAKTKKDQLKNTSTATMLQWTTTPTRLKWCRIMLVCYSNLLQLVQRVIEYNKQMISKLTFHIRPLIKLLSKQFNLLVWTTRSIIIVNNKLQTKQWRTVANLSIM